MQCEASLALGLVCAGRRSVFFRQHDRDHALGDRGVGGIRRVEAARFFEIIDLKEELVAVDFKRAAIPKFDLSEA
jgi:hypothetical protein